MRVAELDVSFWPWVRPLADEHKHVPPILFGCSPETRGFQPQPCEHGEGSSAAEGFWGGFWFLLVFFS